MPRVCTLDSVNGMVKEAMEEIRCFIAIELPDDIREGLGRLIARLKSRQPDVKWVDPAAIHLTLKFLGYVAPDRVGEITEAITDAACGIPPFSLEVKDLGVFPSLNRVRVVWIGVEGETDKLLQLQKRLETNLDILGFPPEEREFTPHLTLARVRDTASPAEREELVRLITATKASPIGSFTAKSVSLMSSQLARTGAVYTQLAAVKLK
ncbi:MAG: RNA 2',3'-cyclic phosphodiesterase [Dehalococcoidales bacterium]|nr:RNA 2',3'-cyclic phosphodiesterase [Dehalococcoidales bacterium]